MEEFYEELWGQSSHLKITQYEVRVPQPEFYIDPEHRARLGAQSSSLQLTGISTKEISKRFTKVEMRNYFPPVTSSFICREEYPRIETLLEVTESEKWENKKVGKRAHSSFPLDYKVSGQPGSGKSTFLQYLLMRRVVARRPTVYRLNDRNCYYFDETSQGHRISLRQLFALPDRKKRDLWILTDEALTDSDWNQKWHGWFVVLAGSLRKVETSHGWAKGRNPDETYINNWEWDEIYAAFTLETKYPSAEQIQKLYTTFICLGPVARTCLETISAKNTTAQYDKSFKAYVNKIDNYIIAASAKFTFGSMTNALGCIETHKIIRIEPCLDNASYTPEIMTRWIACRILNYAGIGAKERGYKIFQSLCQQTMLRSSAGWFFEVYAHDWLRKGGKFDADRLSSKDSSETLLFDIECMRSREPLFYDTLSNVGTMLQNAVGKGVDPRHIGRYFQPRWPTQESFDSFLVMSTDTLILFQITMAMTHDIKVDGVRAILKALPKTIKNVFIVFTIPQICADKYKSPQRVPTNKELSGGKPKYTIKQFRLVFPNDAVLSIAVPKPSHF